MPSENEPSDKIGNTSKNPEQQQIRNSVNSVTPLSRLYSPQPWIMVMKTIKFRIEPNSEQRKVIDQMIDANRLVYNNMLTACKVHYGKTGKLLSSFDLIKMGTRMRNNSSYVAQAYSMTLNETAGRVIKACNKTLGIHEKESGELDIDTFSFNLPDHHFPRYKSYSQFNSITYPSPRDYSVVTEKKGRKNKRMLRLGKIPALIRCYNQSTKFDGIMKTCTIKRKDMGRYSLYFACISYEPSRLQQYAHCL